MSETKRFFQNITPGWLSFSDNDTAVSFAISSVESIISNNGKYWDDETQSCSTHIDLKYKWYSFLCKEPQIKETVVYNYDTYVKPSIKIIMCSGEIHEIKFLKSTIAKEIHEELLGWINEWRKENKPLIT